MPSALRALTRETATTNGHPMDIVRPRRRRWGAMLAMGAVVVAMSVWGGMFVAGQGSEVRDASIDREDRWERRSGQWWITAAKP